MFLKIGLGTEQTYIGAWNKAVFSVKGSVISQSMMEAKAAGANSSNQIGAVDALDVLPGRCLIDVTKSATLGVIDGEAPVSKITGKMERATVLELM